MRAAIVAAVTLALGACQVNVEGAHCNQPGFAEQCPSGQACGNDGRCSERAAACGARCTPGAVGCGGTSGSATVETCTDADPACGAWQASPCASGLVCDKTGHAAACECGAPGLVLHVDAVAGGSDATLVPTGAELPPACRFATIAAALDRAVAGSTVKVVGEPGTYPLPPRLGKGVSLVAGDAPLDPAARVLEDSAAGGPGLVMEEGSRLAGFTVRAAVGDPRPLAIRVDCAGTEKVTLEKVRVDAAASATLTAGIELRGACDVDLKDVEIAGAAGTGLDVSLTPAAAAVSMTAGRVQGCGTGVVLTSGDLRLDRTAVVNNSGIGVEAGDGLLDTKFTASDALFASNADTALVLIGNARVDLRNNRICGNGAVSSWGALARKVGGIFAQGAPPDIAGDLVFKGNEVHHNTADQVLISTTIRTWNVDGGTGEAACASDRNLFFGYDPGTGRGVVTTNASVTARWNGWESLTPIPGTDFEKFGTGDIDTGLGAVAQYCQGTYTPRPCP